MRCPGCQSENPPGMSFCGKCGIRLANLCPKCGFENPSAFDFCGRCGSSLTHSGTALPADHQPRPPGAIQAVLSPIEPHEIPEGERKTVTALFADIKGSMELMEDLDPEEARGKCCLKSTTGSPRASSLPTSRTPRRC